jgi:tellurite resistance protein
MSDPDPIVQLPVAEPVRLAAAVFSVVIEDERRAAKLRAGAQQSVADEPADIETARRFQTLLELGYLVASADGFAEEERGSLAALLETVTGAAVDQEILQQHFRDLDDAVATLGRRERIARVAADLEDTETAEEAIGLAAAIAMADGCLTRAEHQVLLELGEHVKVSPERIGTLVQEIAARVEGKLA